MIKDCAEFSGIGGDELGCMFPTIEESRENIKAMIPWLRSLTSYIVSEGTK